MSAVAVAVGIGGALISSSASKSAAKSSAAASDRAAQVQWDMYDQSRKDALPWLNVGQSALFEIADLYGLQRPNVTIDGETGQVEQSQGTQQATTQQSTTQQQTQPTGFSQGDLAARYLQAKQEFDNRPVASETDQFPTFSQYAAAAQAAGTADVPLSGDFYTWNQAYKNQLVNGASGQQSTGQNTNQQTTDQPTAQERQQNALSRFYQSPDYQFRQSEGQKAIERSAAARGGLYSGATGKALTQYAGNLASGEYGNYINRLASLAGVGQSQSQNLAALGQNTAAGVGNAYQNAGNARASGYLGQANTWGNALNNFSMYNAMGGFGGGSTAPAFAPSNTGGTNYLPTSNFSLGYMGG